MNEQDGRDLLSAVTEYRRKSEAWAIAYDDLRERFADQAEQQKADLADIEDAMNRDMKALRAKTFWNVSIPVTLVTLTFMLLR
jgi:hypothetical protein